MPKNTILFPTIAQDAKNSSLLTVYTDAEARWFLNRELDMDSDSNVSLITKALIPLRLVNPGEISVANVHRLMIFNQPIKSTSWMTNLRLHCSGRSDEGESSQLAFALALLTSRRCLSIGIIATGKLDGTGGIVTIEPVSSIKEKLRLVLSERLAGKSGKLPENRYYFFTPEKYYDKTTRQYYSFADLPKEDESDNSHIEKMSVATLIKELKKEKIEVKPVATLNEVAKQLDLLASFPSKKLVKIRLLINVAIAAVIFLYIGFLIVVSFLNSESRVSENKLANNPLYFAFTSIYNDIKSSTDYPESDFGSNPFLICQNKTTVNYIPIKKVNDKYIVYKLPETSTWKLSLGFKLTPPTEEDVTSKKAIESFNYYAVNIEKKTGLQLIEKLEFKQGLSWIDPGKHFEVLKSSQLDDNLFMVLVSRTPLPLRDLKNKFKVRFRPIIERFEGSKQFFRNETSNEVADFEYTVQLNGDICDKKN